eukprot:TRINITY_DN16796_c2_g1_i1.p1 TRINITY_DN16796_c2_g1~~TRINITY_DN16796_c2_g1_i1.p1  ORF type:complete len:451 (-),score=61.71 TRINITY_DN16796_c2_g1_i1:86-1438(-)
MVQRYEKVRHMSTGRFGVTLLVKAVGRLSVMKTIDVGQFDGKDREVLLEEVLENAQLRHPNLLAVQECFSKDGRLCIISEYVQGGTVAEQVEKAKCAGGKHFDRVQVLYWFSQAVLGLDYLHCRSLAHRDLRTRRLLLSSDGHVYLTGAAYSPLLRHTVSSEKPDLEALRYLSPELLSGAEDHSLQSDIWALGVILYEILCLRPPFDHEHHIGLRNRILSNTLPPPPRCDADLQHLCSQLMEREASDRSPTKEIVQMPIVQERLWSLLSEEPKGPNSNATVLVGQKPSWLLEKPSVLSTVKPRSLGVRPLGGFTTAQAGTPRALRTVGEVCGQQLGGSIAKSPPARFQFKKSIVPSSASEAGASMLGKVIGGAIVGAGNLDSSTENFFRETAMSGMFSTTSSWPQVADPSPTSAEIDNTFLTEVKPSVQNALNKVYQSALSEMTRITPRG